MPTGAYIRSDEYCRKMSAIMKGKRKTEEACRRMSEVAKARMKSPILRKRISDTLKGKYHSEERRRNQGVAIKKAFESPALRKKMSEAHKGKHYPKMSEAKTGIKNNFWKGGISFYPYPTSWTKDLKESIRKRDKQVCQLCGKHQIELEKKLSVHHIDYTKKNLNPDNLISLCNKCHSRTNKDRELWIKYFKSEGKNAKP